MYQTADTTVTAVTLWHLNRNTTEVRQYGARFDISEKRQQQYRLRNETIA